MSVTLKLILQMMNGIHYDRVLQNTVFVKKMMTAPPHVRLFRKVPTETKSISY